MNTQDMQHDNFLMFADTRFYDLLKHPKLAGINTDEADYIRALYDNEVGAQWVHKTLDLTDERLDSFANNFATLLKIARS